MLMLRRATVRAVEAPAGAEQTLVVELEGAADRSRPAIADIGLVGRAEVGDELIVNVEALDLELGSGGADVVHVNLTRGLRADGRPPGNVMKLNYTSLQHTVRAVEDQGLQLPVERPAAVLALHG